MKKQLLERERTRHLREEQAESEKEMVISTAQESTESVESEEEAKATFETIMDEKPHQTDLSNNSTSSTTHYHCRSSENINKSFGNEMDEEPLDLSKNSVSSTKIDQIKNSEKHTVADKPGTPSKTGFVQECESTDSEDTIAKVSTETVHFTQANYDSDDVVSEDFLPKRCVESRKKTNSTLKRNQDNYKNKLIESSPSTEITVHESRTQPDPECKDRAIGVCSCSGPSTSANRCPCFLATTEPSMELNQADRISQIADLSCPEQSTSANCPPDFVTIQEPSTDLNRESSLISGHCGIGSATDMDKSCQREICGERNSENHEPTIQMRRQNRDQLFPFQECKRAFVSSCNLNTHIKRKMYEKKSFSCQICSKGFSRKRDMERHNRTHTGEKPYACPRCGKLFSDKANMKVHTQTHTQEKPHTCPFCGRKFFQKGNMETHTKTHTGETLYACSICGKAYSRKASMERHKKAKHK